MMNINNLPEYANNYKYIVCRVVNGALWFWGAYNEQSRAAEAAAAVGGTVVAAEQAATGGFLNRTLTQGSVNFLQEKLTQT